METVLHETREIDCFIFYVCANLMSNRRKSFVSQALEFCVVFLIHFVWLLDFSDLHEGALLENIRRRYNNERIYTYTGTILVAVNPYKMYDRYGMDYVRKYEGQLIGKLPAHIFAIGSTAFAQMMKTRSDQCIVISGESGAGKTESTKLIMQYLAAVNKSSSSLITEQVSAVFLWRYFW